MVKYAQRSEFQIICRDNSFYIQSSIKTAELLRKVYHADGEYTKSGWAKHQIGVNT